MTHDHCWPQALRRSLSDNVTQDASAFPNDRSASPQDVGHDPRARRERVAHEDVRCKVVQGVHRSLVAENNGTGIEQELLQPADQLQAGKRLALLHHALGTLRKTRQLPALTHEWLAVDIRRTLNRPTPSSTLSFSMGIESYSKRATLPAPPAQ